MASSKDVMTVLGMLVSNANFRADFFQPDNAIATAEAVVGRLSADEKTQIQRVAGNLGPIPKGATRAEYVMKVGDACQAVSDEMTCPSPPCPDNDLY